MEGNSEKERGITQWDRWHWLSGYMDREARIE
jgi:hypothetical protein